MLARRPGALRPPLRARRLRRRVRGHPDRRAQPRHRAPRRSPPCATSTTAAPPAPRPNSGDGAGILLQVPDAFLREVVDFELPAPGRVRRRHGVPRRATPTRSPRPGSGSRSSPTRRASTVLGWRDVPVDPDLARRDRPRRDAARSASSSSRRPAPGSTGHGAGAAGVLPAQAGRARDRGLLRARCQRAHPALQGHAHHRPARPVLPRPRRRAGRLGPGRRPLALLDQHLPELAAGPPVPLHRPQRRDQHRDGQPQLDAGPRGAARLRPDPGRPRAALPDLHAGRLRLRVSFDEVLELLHMGGRTPAARGADDDPGGVGEPRARWTPSAGRSTSSTPR